MVNPIINVTITSSPNRISTEWAMAIHEKRWIWSHRYLEVRMFFLPFPDSLKVTLVNATPISSLPESDYAFVNIDEDKLIQGYFHIEKSVNTDSGKFYRLLFNMGDVAPSPKNAHEYLAVNWEIKDDWREVPFSCWLEFGHSTHEGFVLEHRTDVFEFQPTSSNSHTNTTDVSDYERVRKYRATKRLFISYSHADIFAVNQIARKLNEEFYYDIWIDYDSIPGGSQWKEEIIKGIESSAGVLFMLSSNSTASQWCREEIRYALEKKVPIIPIRIDGTCDEIDLENIGLGGTQFRDFSRTPAEWNALITLDLPEVMPRNRRWQDKLFRKKHTDYLRHLFHRLNPIDISYLLEAAPKEEVSLMDVYVPLSVGYAVWGTINDGELVNWWIGPEEENSNTILNLSSEKTPPKSLPDIQFDQSILEIIIDRVTKNIKARKTQESHLKNGHHVLWRFEPEHLVALQHHLVITGDPGSGKSTLIKYLTLCMAGDQLFEATDKDESRAGLDLLSFWPLPAYTPVFIELRDLVRKKFPTSDETVTLQKLYDYLSQEQLAVIGNEDYIDDLRDQMRDGDVMFLLDGLDEVSDAQTDKRRSQIKDLINLLRNSFPKCRIVITARKYAYAGDWKLEGFGKASVSSLNSERLEQLATKLFCQVLENQIITEQTRQFNVQIRTVPRDLRNSPLFFTLLATLWLNKQDIPPDKRLPVVPSAIYCECIDMLIRRWTTKDLQQDSALIDSIGLNKNQLRDLLERLAYHTHQNSAFASDSGFECGLIMTILRKEMKMKGVDYDTLLDTLSQRAGVIVETAPDEFDFIHSSFREYLSAGYWATPFRYPHVLVHDIDQDPLLWRNVFELFPEEANRANLDLWKAVEALLPEKSSEVSTEQHRTFWWKTYYAARLIQTLILPNARQLDLFRDQLVHLLVEMILKSALPPQERSQMGCVLSALGDPRKGVGHDKNGIPDIEWIEIPQGKFLMGAEKITDALASIDEIPQKTIILPTYFIAKNLITNAQFNAFVEDKAFFETLKEKEIPSTKHFIEHLHIADSGFKYANHPRENVDWYQAVLYCHWLSDKTGYEVRLPTEEEWEKAARGLDGLIYAYGDEFDASKANTGETQISQTSSVGIFPDGASPFGVMDMCGNVFEWTSSEENEEHIFIKNSVALQIIKGGSWRSDKQSSRTAFRASIAPKERGTGIGFRLATKFKSIKKTHTVE